MLKQRGTLQYVSLCFHIALFSLLIYAANGGMEVSMNNNKKHLTLNMQEIVSGYLFIAPILLSLIVWTVGPVLYSLYISFQQFSFLNPSAAKWVYFDNYIEVFQDKTFHKALLNTLKYSAAVVPIQTFIALVLGYICSRKIRFKTFFRGAYYLPSVTSSVAVSTIFMFLFSGKGIINIFMVNFGFEAKSWFATPKYALMLCMVIAIWTTVGTFMIVFMAGLADIPNEIYEAAAVDGANEIQNFFKITVPLLRPTTFFVVIIGLIGTLQIFDYAFIISKGEGGPVDSTLTIVLYLYKKAFKHFDMGYASAMAFILFIIIFAITLIQKKFFEQGMEQE